MRAVLSLLRHKPPQLLLQALVFGPQLLHFFEQVQRQRYAFPLHLQIITQLGRAPGDNQFVVFKTGCCGSVAWT